MVIHCPRLVAMTTVTMASFRFAVSVLLMSVVLLWRSCSAVVQCPSKCVCLHNLTVVDCSRAGFSAIPAIPASTQALILDNNPLVSLAPDVFCNVTDARQLSLQNCQLRSVSELAFRGMNRLTSLVLAKNLLSELPRRLLSDNTGLENLVLSDNRLTLSSLARVVSGLRNLKLLDIGSNVVDGESLPVEFSDLVQLKTLKLNKVVMSELPANYFKPLENGSLVELVISGRLANVSQYALSDMTSLQTLDVSDTLMTSHDAANLLHGLKNASYLAVLDMDSVFSRPRSNSTIHKHFFLPLTSTAVKVIRFRSNPHAFSGVLQHRLFRSLHGLAELYLDGCALHAIHGDAFHGLGRLRVLSLRANFLTCHDRTACGFLTGKGHGLLAGLELLDLSYNNIVSTPELVFHGHLLPRLQTLYLAHNRLTRIHEGVFRGLDKLRLLDLARNPIAAVDPDALADLSQLVDLHLNGTDVLDSLPARAFQGCKKLKVLDVADGDLSTVDWQTFKGLKKLQYLNLRNNYIGAMDTLSNVTVDAPNLWKLDLGYNRLTSIPEFVSSLKNLRDLFLDNNYLRDDSIGRLANNTGLQVLDLSFNSITHLNAEALVASHARLDKITMEGNPFMCDCDWPSVGNAFLEANVTVVGVSNHKCSAPKDVRGANIFTFRPSQWHCSVRLFVVPATCVLCTLFVCALFVFVRKIGCDRARIQIKDFCNWDNCYFRLNSNLEATDLNDQDSRL